MSHIHVYQNNTITNVMIFVELSSDTPRARATIHRRCGTSHSHLSSEFHHYQFRITVAPDHTGYMYDFYTVNFEGFQFHLSLILFWLSLIVVLVVVEHSGSRQLAHHYSIFSKTTCRIN